MKSSEGPYSDLEQWLFDGGWNRKQIAIMIHTGQEFGYSAGRYKQKMSEPYAGLLVRDVDTLARAMNCTAYDVLMRIISTYKEAPLTTKKIEAIVKAQSKPKEVVAMSLRDNVTPERIKNRK